MQSKLIVALDFDSELRAMKCVSQLNPQECALKVGSELFTRLGPEFVRTLVEKKFNVFLDLKFHDIPNTVAHACQVAASLGVWMVNVHALGGEKMMRAAREAIDASAHQPLLIAVTVLTSMDEEMLNEVGVKNHLESHVVHLAAIAQKARLDGVVCSASEVSAVKAHCGSSFLAVTPGIRLPHQSFHDQTRVWTPEAAIRAGSDYLVMGRAITEAASPCEIIQQLLRVT